MLGKPVINNNKPTFLYFIKNIISYFFQVAVLCLAAAVAAEPEADAAVAYGYGYNYPVHAYGYNNYGYNGYAYGYPAYGYGAAAYGYGAGAAHSLGKREAEASVLPYGAAPYVAAPYAYSPYTYAYAPVASSYQQVSTPAAAYGLHQLHKREAEPQGVAVHPGFATSSTFRSPQGASALYGYPSIYGYGYGYPAYGHYLGKREAEAEPQGVAVHPGYATSSVYRSTQGAPALYPYAPYYGVYGGYGYF